MTLGFADTIHPRSDRAASADLDRGLLNLSNRHGQGPASGMLTLTRRAEVEAPAGLSTAGERPARGK